MIVRSPRCSDRANAHLPSASCQDLHVPATSSRSANPLPRPDVNMPPFADTASAWNIFPQRRKLVFLNGMKICPLSPWVATVSAHLQLVLLLGDKGKEAAVLEPRTPGPADTTAPAPGHAGQSRSQKTCSRPTNTHCGRPKTKQKYRKSRKA